jgi:protein O-GlcNAc transferase
MKKVISFSIWGNNEGYCQGAVENALLAPKIYPGWICRFYVDPFVPRKIVCQLLDLGCEIIYREESIDNLGLYWRFGPMFDDIDIERFIVRDTDSRINVRESQAVDEWEDSGLLFHIIRDNNEHNIKILGGTWGSKAGIIPHFKMLMDSWIAGIQPDTKNPRGIYHGTDQIFLSTVIWPFIERCHMAHDNYFKFTGREKPLTVKLKRDGYVGMVYSEENHDRTLGE